MAYKKYGDEWEKEVSRNPKKVIIAILRNVAKERDGLVAAQQDAQAGLVLTCQACTEKPATVHYCGDCYFGNKPSR